jgi:GxxExxY protein
VSRLSRRRSSDHPVLSALVRLALPLFFLVATPVVTYFALGQINMIGPVASLIQLVATAIMFLAGAWIVIYEWCLTKEFELRGLTCVSQKLVMIEYKGFTREEPLRFDMLVEGCVLVEAKAVEKILPIHKAQLLSYMKLLNVPLGLLINFHEIKLTDGVHRLILPGANR